MDLTGLLAASVRGYTCVAVRFFSYSKLCMVEDSLHPSSSEHACGKDDSTHFFDNRRLESVEGLLYDGPSTDSILRLSKK